jgi:hypothetical protein
MMNELEVVYYSLFLDKLEWATDGHDTDENLLMTGLSVKMFLNYKCEYSHIIQHLKKTRNVEERFNIWLGKRNDYEKSMIIPPRELNETYYMLTKQVNIYCKQNYIDHNFVVDQILQMSLPYSEGKHHQEKSAISSIDDTFEAPSNIFIKQNNPSQSSQIIFNNLNTNYNNLNLPHNHDQLNLLIKKNGQQQAGIFF